VTDLEKLLAIEAIKDIFAKKLRYMDLKQWDDYASLHAEDAYSETWKHSLPTDEQPMAADGQRGRVVGPEAIAGQLARVFTHPTPITSVHHCHGAEIEFLSDTEARGIWAMEDSLWWRNGDVEEHLHGYGHYHETFRKTGGRWLFTSRQLIRIRVDMTPDFWSRLTMA